MKRFLIFSVLWCGFSVQHAHANPTFLSISKKADKAHVRSGPNIKYPIQWVYQRPTWPFEVMARFEDWVKVRDIYGEAGWIHKRLLSRARYVIVNGTGVQDIFHLPSVTSKVIFIAENGVIAQLESCKNVWCEITLNEQKGWIERRYLWGVEEE